MVPVHNTNTRLQLPQRELYMCNVALFFAPGLNLASNAISFDWESANHIARIKLDRVSSIQQNWSVKKPSSFFDTFFLVIFLSAYFFRHHFLALLFLALFYCLISFGTSFCLDFLQSGNMAYTHREIFSKSY